MNKFFKLTKATLKHWYSHKPASLAAALSYYAVFSIIPLSLIIIPSLGIIFGQALIQTHIFQYLKVFLGNDTANFIITLINTTGNPFAHIVANLTLIGTLILGAIGIFSELDNALNKLWELPITRGRFSIKKNGLWEVLKSYWIPFLLIPISSIILFVSLILNVFLNALGTASIIAFHVSLFNILNTALSFILFIIFISLVYRLLPQYKLPWKQIIYGASMTAIFLLIGEIGVSIYLTHSTSISMYGAVGSLITIMIWVYYSAQIFFLGASFTYINARNHGIHSHRKILKKALISSGDETKQ